MSECSEDRGDGEISSYIDRKAYKKFMRERDNLRPILNYFTLYKLASVR